jgi:hypothetical protein
MRKHGPGGFDMLPTAMLPYGNQAFWKTLSYLHDQALSSLVRRTHKRRDSQESRWAESTPKWARLISRQKSKERVKGRLSREKPSKSPEWVLG